MIKINDTKIIPEYFPDGTLNLKYEIPYMESHVYVSWNFERNEELVMLIFLTNHLRNKGISDIELIMSYLPNARMDRVKERDEVFTLKYFCDIINSLNFSKVYVSDVHSNVGVALLDRVYHISAKTYIQRTVGTIFLKDEEKPMLFYPDEGAMKRYSGALEMEYVFGIKDRDWKTGKIKSLEVFGDTEKIKGKSILIVDDICSKGGTFFHSAKRLKELGANKIYLYVTHCEDTIFKGELLKGDLIERIFTTDSLITKTHEKITII